MRACVVFVPKEGGRLQQGTRLVAGIEGTGLGLGRARRHLAAWRAQKVLRGACSILSVSQEEVVAPAVVFVLLVEVVLPEAA